MLIEYIKLILLSLELPAQTSRFPTELLRGPKRDADGLAIAEMLLVWTGGEPIPVAAHTLKVMETVFRIDPAISFAPDNLGAPVTAASSGASAGVIVGASIGSAIFPLAGTVIGGGVGALLGAIGARGLVDDYINDFKFRETNDAYEYFSDKYSDGFDESVQDKMKKKYYYVDKIEKNITLEETGSREN